MLVQISLMLTRQLGSSGVLYMPLGTPYSMEAPPTGFQICGNWPDVVHEGSPRMEPPVSSVR